MGFFNKIKNMFKGNEDKEVEQSTDFVEKNKDEEVSLVEDKKEEKSIKVYEKGLTKSREGFVSKLVNLTNKYKKITDEYFN